MPIDLNPMYLALGAVETALWPEITGHGFWEGERTNRIPWASLAPPYAVNQVQETGDGDWSMDVQTAEVEVDVFYLIPDSADLKGLRTKLYALKNALFHADELRDGGGNLVGQVLSTSRPTWSDSLPANMELATQQGGGRAGRLTVNVLLEEPYA